jgi:hypothetical protein
MSAALNARSGDGEMGSNSRMVALLIAPVSYSAARSDRNDSTIYPQRTSINHKKALKLDRNFRASVQFVWA